MDTSGGGCNAISNDIYIALCVLVALISLTMEAATSSETS
jgi:hypothetical protein